MSDWWKGFNAPSLKHACSAEWRIGYNDAKEIDRRLSMKAAKGREPYNPNLCVNCFDSIPTKKSMSSLTCCNSCQQIAEGVRGLRRWTSDPNNVLNMDEINQRQRFVCCAVSKDGYDKNSRKISRELREYIYQRVGYKCELCGRPQGDSPESRLTIQHMFGSSNAPNNLKAYCHHCNTIEALPFLTPNQLASYSSEQIERLGLFKIKDADALREPHIEILMREIQLRVLASAPIIPCDDANSWNDRRKEFQTKRRNHIKAKRTVATKPTKARSF